MYKSGIIEMALQSKLIVYLAIIGVLALMGGIIFYASLDNDELALIEIELTNVETIRCKHSK